MSRRSVTKLTRQLCGVLLAAALTVTGLPVTAIQADAVETALMTEESSGQSESADTDDSSGVNDEGTENNAGSTENENNAAEGEEGSDDGQNAAGGVILVPPRNRKLAIR
ncbi:MAG: hypothetical protein LUI12_06170 [Clostridiales bacterium]|nr:hypothetical protein [Clostridiales bacterium]